jgi:hypothetical protein
VTNLNSHTGGVGAAVTTGSTIVQWISAADPLLHAISTCVAIIAGVLTIVWYVKQLRKSSPQ